MNNMSSYCGLVDAKIRASDKDLPVQQQSSGNTANIIGSDDPIKVSTSSLSRSYYTKKTSPHAVLGNFEIN
jgi:hypothetical protein